MNNNTSIDKGQWKEPAMEYRPVPFWVWNEKQEPDELRRQIREMKEQGFGGFFMHARIGLKTPYLSDEWFRHINISVEEAAKLGMKAWIYDEDRWPSGFAGGQIADVAGLDYAAYGLQLIEDRQTRRYEVVRSQASEVLNGASDPDMLNPDVVAAFLRLTHDRYEKEAGKNFVTTIPGSFADEPSYILWSRPDRFSLLPWTRDIEQIFASRRGYQLKPHLDSLFFNEGDYRRIRVDFYRTITERFIESFARQVYDWCQVRNLRSTGHMMMEDTLLSQVRAIGAAMPHYEWFQDPGIDHLGYAVNPSPLLVKQCASVARQIGQKRMLSELFGGCGWNATIRDLKPAGDWDFALGVNVLNQHLAYYSIRGCRKRDYPSSCSYHQPGYSLYRSFNDYYSRLSYMLTRGETVRRILVLHPIASAWALYTPRDTAAVEELDKRFQDLSAHLLEIQRDFDYGDEFLMERHGRVEDKCFIVGRASYDAVVVPSAETWSANTFKLLKQFADHGGVIIVVEPSARFLDGVLSAELESFLQSAAVRRVTDPTPAALERALNAVPRDVIVRRSDGKKIRELVYLHNNCGSRDIYFLTFGRMKKPARLTVSLEGTGAVEQWNAETGETVELPAAVENNHTMVEVDIPEKGSCLLVLDRERYRHPERQNR